MGSDREDATGLRWLTWHPMESNSAVASLPGGPEACGGHGHEGRAVNASPVELSTMHRRIARAALVSLLSAAAAVSAAGDSAPSEARANYFNDPFLQVTNGIADCPVPQGPMITKDEMRAQAHSRTERGTSCYLSGRCRLSNSYLYDKEIVPRVKKAILADGRFADTSVWAEGQRRWVWLKGCVGRKDQAEALEALVRSLDDVEAVIDELVVRAH